MTLSERTEQAIAHGFRLNWGPVIAGAIAASALAFVLDSFGLALGLAISSRLPPGGIHHLPLSFCLDFILFWWRWLLTVLVVTSPVGCGGDLIQRTP